MNKLNLYSGGHPLVVEDLNLLQSAYRDGFAALAGFLTNGNTQSIILSGCQHTQSLGGGLSTVTAGYLIHEGEIWYTPGGFISGSGLFLEPSITYQAPTPVLYASAASHDVREIRTMTLGVGTPPAGGILYANLSPAWEVWKQKATPPIDLNLLLPNAGVGFINSAVYRDVTGRVYLKGDMTITPGLLAGTPPHTNIPIMQLTGLEPAQTTTLPVLGTLPNYQTYALRIDALGNVSLLTDAATPITLNTKIHLDNVHWI